MNADRHELTDEALTELLAQPADAAGVAAAGAEAVALHAALRTYRTETLQWAERRSSTQPSLQAAARRSRVWAAVPQWSLAAVAVISIAAGVARVYDFGDPGEGSVPTASAVASTSPTAASAADIAADNALLSSIDQELSYHAASPVDSLGLKSSHTTQPEAPGVID